MVSDLHGDVLAAGESRNAFAPSDKTAARAFAANVKRVSLSLCYCSVLDDCWTISAVGDDGTEPKSTGSCPKPAVPFEN